MGGEKSSCLGPNGLWGVARSPSFSPAHPFLRPSGSATHPEPHILLHPGPHSPPCGPEFFQAALLVPHDPPRHPTTSSSRFSGLVEPGSRQRLPGSGVSATRCLFCPVPTTSPSLLSSPAFDLGHPLVFWGDPKRGPPGHSSLWPPGVRLCPAGRKVLVHFHAISQALETRASWRGA